MGSNNMKYKNCSNITGGSIEQDYTEMHTITTLFQKYPIMSMTNCMMNWKDLKMKQIQQ